MINLRKISLLTLFLITFLSLNAAETVDSLATAAPTPKSVIRQQHRDSVRANKKVWTSILGGPSYTPEASLGVAGAVLLSFKTNAQDTISQRSFLPAGFNVSINGTFVFAGMGALFFNENRFRIYSSYGYRNEPANFYGVGFDQIDQTERGEDTEYHKSSITFYNRFVWEVKPKFYMGPLMDINFSNSTEMSEKMAENPYIAAMKSRYTNIGLGGLIQYDTRDDVATPNSGVLLSAIARIYGKSLGGSYNYQYFDFEYRQFQPLFKRAILAWTARTQISYGDVPFTELPTFGSPFDLRGFYWGQFRDKSMGYGIVEYRQMFGTQEAYEMGKAITKFGYVVWGGAGTLGVAPTEWGEFRYNYGVGLRAQIQPRKNFRLDIGKGVGEEGVLVYFNMTEAF
ncbi:MAG: BamA/TamA family outer membrane protein [Rikenellaceae bacterium]